MALPNAQALENISADHGAVQVVGNAGPITINYSRKRSILQIELTEDAPTASVENVSQSYYMLPSVAVSKFVERPDLMEQLEEALALGKSPSIAVLLGMGGQGKSQLALEYCRAAKYSKNCKAILWIDASTDASLRRSFEGISAKITGTARTFKNLTSDIATIKEAIEGWTDPWLLVFDNYDMPQKTINISTCFPQTKFGSIIVTSRHADSKRLGNVINVKGMSEKEGLELLFNLTDLPRTEENKRGCIKIMEQLGFHPLALDQAASYIGLHSLSVSSFTTEFRERREHILQYTPLLSEYRKHVGDSSEETALNVFTTLELSLQGIDERKNVRKAVEDFLTLSAFFNTAKIGEDLFKLVSNGYKPSWRSLFTTREELKWTKPWAGLRREKVWNHYKYRDMVTRLNGLSLIESVSSEDDMTYFSLHSLVADWLRFRSDKITRRTNTMQSSSAVTDFIDSTDVQALGFQNRQYWLAHVSSCWEHQDAFLESPDSSSIAVADQWFSFGLFFYYSGNYTEAEEALKRTLAIYEKTKGLEHQQTLELISNLGTLYHEIRRLDEAEDMLKRALQGKEKTLGLDDESTFEIVNNLGLLYSDMERADEAEEALTRALKGKEKTLGPDHVSTLETLSNLGNQYALIGRLKEAEEMFNKALIGMEKTLGPDHASIPEMWNSLGSLYAKQKRTEEAEKMYVRSIKGKEKIFGPNHRKTIDSVYNLGTFYMNIGRLEEARAMFERAADGYRDIFGEEHPETVDARSLVEDVRKLEKKKTKQSTEGLASIEMKTEGSHHLKS